MILYLTTATHFSARHLKLDFSSHSAAPSSSITASSPMPVLIVLTQETFLFLATFDMPRRWTPDTPSVLTHTHHSPPLAAACSTIEMSSSLNVLHSFPHDNYPHLPGASPSNHSPAKHAPQLTPESVGGVGVWNKKLPVRGRNRMSTKVSSVSHLKPHPPCQWLSTLFRFITPVWICSQTSGWCPSSVMPWGHEQPILAC